MTFTKHRDDPALSTSSVSADQPRRPSAARRLSARLSAPRRSGALRASDVRPTGRELGRGSFGVVTLATTRRGAVEGGALPAQLAVKTVRRARSTTSSSVTPPSDHSPNRNGNGKKRNSRPPAGLRRALAARRAARREHALHARVSGHAHVATLYAALRRPTGPALAIELLSGGSVRDALRARPTGLPLRGALEIARQVADALAHSHARGVAHRDVKPHNVLFAAAPAWPSDADRARGDQTGGRAAAGVAGSPAASDSDMEEGVENGVDQLNEEYEPLVKLVDFGLATSFDVDDTTTWLSYARVGTAAYMPPEVHAGGPSRVTEADAYGLGAMLFEMVCGQPPFGGARGGARERDVVAAKLAGVRFVQPVWGGVPVEVKALVAELLTPVRGKRPALADVAARLRSIVDRL